MPIIFLPIEIITQIIDLIDKSRSTEPHNAKMHREMCKTLMALRLSCKDLEAIATRKLFQIFCLSPSLQSWVKLHLIAKCQRLRVNLQILALERCDNEDNKPIIWDSSTFKQMAQSLSQMPFPSVYAHSQISFWPVHTYAMKLKDSSEATLPWILDLSLLPNLKVLKAEDKWVISKKSPSNTQIPQGVCKIHALSFFRYGPTIWDMFLRLTEITKYGFQISSLNCKLSDVGPWGYLLEMDLTSLKSLRLYFEKIYRNHAWDIRADKVLLTKLKNLPNLEEFYLDQNFPDRSDPESWMLDTMTNVLKQLAGEKTWPRLRLLDLRYAATTVADFQAFVAPHVGKLQTLRLHGGFVCARVTPEEKRRRYYLPEWIQAVICPQDPKGEGAKVECIVELPEELYYAKYLDDYTDGEGTEDEDAEEESAEEDGLGQVDTEQEGAEQEDTEQDGTEQEGTEQEGAEQEDEGTKQVVTKEEGTKEENTEEKD